VSSGFTHLSMRKTLAYRVALERDILDGDDALRAATIKNLADMRIGDHGSGHVISTLFLPQGRVDINYHVGMPR
jgi:hypothetical protein